MLKSRIPLTITLAVALSGLVPQAVVRAATSDTAAEEKLGEIVVTARKREERLIDVPESITALSAQDLTERSVFTIEDVGRQTPNLQLNMRQDLTTNVVIRGVGAYGDVLGVGFSIDDVPNFTDQTMRLDDVDRVEILKGPQGTLYGASSIGGLVRYVSKRPEFNWQGELSTEVGSYNTVNTSGAQNIPLIDGTLALRVSGYDVKSDGYVRNTELNIDANPLTDYGFRTMLLYKPTDDLEALLTVRHSYIATGAGIYIPVPTVKSYTVDAQFFQPTYNTRNTNGVVLELNDQFSFAKFTSITSFAKADYTNGVDASQTPAGIPGLSIYTLPGNRPTVVETQELRLTSPSTGNFTWLAGAYGAIIKNVPGYLNQLEGDFIPGSSVVLNDFDSRRADTAVFGTVSYSIGPLHLDGGVRLNKTVYDANVYTEYGGLPNQSNSITTRDALPKFSLSYALPTGGQVYATVAKGEEPGAINTVSTAPIPFKAETALSYETGVKGEALNRAFEYELAAFYISNKSHQYQTNVYSPTFGLVSAIGNIGDSRNYGVEGALNWRPTNELRFGINGGYLNAKWTHAQFFTTPIDGKEIPNAPDVTVNLNSGYSKPVFTDLKLDFNFNVNYTDAMWWDLPNTPSTKEPPHFLGDARVALGTDRRGWQVALRVSNLFGAKYWTEYFPGFFPPGAYPCAGCSDMGAPGAPRQIFGSVSYKY
jgi:iron complex outermembrane receptor protein